MLAGEGRFVTVVPRPVGAHECRTPKVMDYGYGTVWVCDCGRSWKLTYTVGPDIDGVMDIPYWRRYPRWYDRIASFLKAGNG